MEFKVGDNVISIINNSFLTKYKTYKITRLMGNFICLDVNPWMLHNVNEFISLNEYRKLKIQKLKK